MSNDRLVSQKERPQGTPGIHRDDKGILEVLITANMTGV